MTQPIVAALLERLRAPNLAGEWPYNGHVCHMADALEAATLIESQAVVIASASSLLDHWDRNGPEYRSEYDGDIYWSPAARSIDTVYIVELRAALAAAKTHTEATKP